MACAVISVPVVEKMGEMTATFEKGGEAERLGFELLDDAISIGDTAERQSEIAAHKGALIIQRIRAASALDLRSEQVA